MNKDKIKKFFQKSSINSGDIVYFASDSTYVIMQALREMGEKQYVDSQQIIKRTMDLFLDALIDLIGENGTILIPTFNWDFCKGMLFDYNKTKSQTGCLGEYALMRGDFKRTWHPIYSFAVWGQDQDYLLGLHNLDSWGSDSPFAYLQHHRNAKFISMGIRNAGEGFTFLHYVEEAHGVPWRFLKTFSGEYIDTDGKKSTKSCTMYVRYLDQKIRTISREEFFVNNGIMKIIEANGLLFKVMSFYKAYDLIWKELEYNQGKGIIMSIKY